MKSILIISLLNFTSFEATHAQYYSVKKKMLEDFNRCSKMKVILTGDMQMDSFFKAAVQNHWDVKDVEFVSKETDKTEEKEGQIYMVCGNNSPVTGNRPTWVKLLIVDREKPSDKINYSPTVIGADFADFANGTDAAWRFDFIIKELNTVMQIIVDNNLTDLNFMDFVRMINGKASVLKEK